MPIESQMLKNSPFSIEKCKNCGENFPCFLRGQVQSFWRRIFGMKYCAVICHKCKKIIGWEKPNGMEKADASEDK